MLPAHQEELPEARQGKDLALPCVRALVLSLGTGSWCLGGQESTGGALPARHAPSVRAGVCDVSAERCQEDAVLKSDPW